MAAFATAYTPSTSIHRKGQYHSCKCILPSASSSQRQLQYSFRSRMATNTRVSTVATVFACVSAEDEGKRALKKKRGRPRKVSESASTSSRNKKTLAADAKVDTEVESRSDIAWTLRDEEKAVIAGMEWRDGRYGTCFKCEAAVVIPGLSHAFCEHCGWVPRPDPVETVSPGHHD